MRGGKEGSSTYIKVERFPEFIKAGYRAVYILCHLLYKQEWGYNKYLYKKEKKTLEDYARN